MHSENESNQNLEKCGLYFLSVYPYFSAFAEIREVCYWHICLMNINLLFFFLKVDHSLYKLLYTPLCSSNMESFHGKNHFEKSIHH